MVLYVYRYCLYELLCFLLAYDLGGGVSLALRVFMMLRLRMGVVNELSAASVCSPCIGRT